MRPSLEIMIWSKRTSRSISDEDPWPSQCDSHDLTVKCPFWGIKVDKTLGVYAPGIY